MLKRRSHKRSESVFLRLRRQRIKNVFYFLAALAGVFYAREGFLTAGKSEKVPSSDLAEVQILLEKEQKKPNFSELCRHNPTKICPDNRQTSDFLYNDGQEIAVIRAEEVNAEYIEKSMRQNPRTTAKLAKLLQEGISFDLRPQSADMINAQELDSQSILDLLYEEKLPDNVIDEGETQTEFIHLNHKKITEIQFVPDKKPAYFGKNPVIAVVIDDMGISQKRTADIAKLEAPLTAAFLTYAQNLERQAQNSRLAGHEIMLHVPMEPQRKADVAPDTLTTDMNEKDLADNFAAMLDKIQDIKGVNNHMGSKLTEDEPRMEVIMSQLKKRDLFFLDSKTSAKSKAAEAARRHQVVYAQRHVFLDNQNDKSYIMGQLETTEKLARKNGYAIAIGHPKNATYDALKEWLSTLSEKKIKLVHLSEIINVLRKRPVY